MICIYDNGNENYEGNGDVILTPTECRHTQTAAGKYDLTIVHPIDPQGKWEHIVEEAVIRAPVQKETIETAWSGMDVDLYQTTGAAALRSGPTEPTEITYTAWNGYATYSVGDKVSAEGWTHRNYQCVYFDGDDPARFVPPWNSSWWTPISDTTSGSPVLVNLKAGTYLYFIESVNATWAKMATRYGMEGYIKKSQMTFVRHLTPEETQPRTITTQLFRIRTVDADSKAQTVTATAEHVSYDMRGVIVKDVTITKQNPATALAWVEQGCMMDYRGTIASDMTGENDGEYTGRFNGKNLIYCLLDPDKGIVASAGAKYRRDNWDVFVMKKTNIDRGFRLRYRKNMLGAHWSRRSDALATRIVPVAKDADGNDFFLDEDGAEWVDSPFIDDYPVIRMEWLKVRGQVGKDDGTESATDWTEETLRAEMKKQALERFNIDRADQVVHDITIDFEQLGDTDEYKALRGLEQALMYDTVIAENETIGLSVSAEVVEIEYDCIREKVAALRISNVNAYGGKNVAGFMMQNNTITGDKLTDDAAEDILGTTEEDAVTRSRTYTNSQISSVRTWVTNNFVAQ